MKISNQLRLYGNLNSKTKNQPAKAQAPAEETPAVTKGSNEKKAVTASAADVLAVYGMAMLSSDIDLSQVVKFVDSEDGSVIVAEEEVPL